MRPEEFVKCGPRKLATVHISYLAAHIRMHIYIYIYVYIYMYVHNLGAVEYVQFMFKNGVCMFVCFCCLFVCLIDLFVVCLLACFTSMSKPVWMYISKNQHRKCIEFGTWEARLNRGISARLRVAHQSTSLVLPASGQLASPFLGLQLQPS